MVKGLEDQIRKYCRLMLVYVIGSLLTLMHYRIEPPASYSAWVNFTIAGEGVSALILTIVIIRVLYLNQKQMFVDPAKDLAQLIETNVDDEDDEIETFNRDKVEKARRRSRSQTPTGSTQL